MQKAKAIALLFDQKWGFPKWAYFLKKAKAIALLLDINMDSEIVATFTPESKCGLTTWVKVVVGENFSIFFKIIKFFFIIDSGAEIIEEFDAAVLFIVNNRFFDIFQSKSTLVRPLHEVLQRYLLETRRLCLLVHCTICSFCVITFEVARNS